MEEKRAKTPPLEDPLSLMKNSEEKKENLSSSSQSPTAEQIDEEMIRNIEEGKIAEDPEDLEDFGGPVYEFYTKLKYVIHPIDGLVLKDKETISKQRKVIITLVKNIGSQILRGGSILNVSLPVTVFEPKSMLQRLAESYQFYPYFLELAANAESPLEKIKYLSTLTLATLHLEILQEKPFNPIWGETFEAKIGEYDILLEQICHHPAISSIQIMGPKFFVAGDLEIEAKTLPNSAKGYRKGKATIILNDNLHTTYTISHCPCILGGLNFGRRTFHYFDKMRIQDLSNSLFADIRMNPDEQGFISGIFRKQKTRKDYFKGVITKNIKRLKEKSNKIFENEDVISKIEGNWLENVKFDDEVCWEIEKYPKLPIIPKSSCLASDSRYRTDLIAFINGDQELAQKEKERLENIQRNDRKLRKIKDKEVKKQKKQTIKEKKQQDKIEKRHKKEEN